MKTEGYPAQLDSPSLPGKEGVECYEQGNV